MKKKTSIIAFLCVIIAATLIVSACSSVDKTALNAAITNAQSFDAAEYTEESFGALSKALDAAKTVASDNGATEEQVRSATFDLEVAVDNLIVKPKVSKIALQTYYNRVKDEEKSDYTDSSYTAFKTALTNAATVLDNAAATQSKVDEALKALRNAYTSLEVDQSSRLANLYETAKNIKAEQFISNVYYSYFKRQLEAMKSGIENAISAGTEDEKNYSDKIEELLLLTDCAAYTCTDFSAEQGNNNWYYIAAKGFNWNIGEGTAYGPTGIYEMTYTDGKYVGADGQFISADKIDVARTYNNRPAIVKWVAPQAGIFDIKMTLDPDCTREGYTRLSIRIMLRDADGGFRFIVAEKFDIGVDGQSVTLVANDFSIEEGEMLYFIVHDENNPVTECSYSVSVYSTQNVRYDYALKTEIAIAEKIDGNYYSEDSFNAMTGVLDQSKAVIGNIGSSQADINAATANLYAARQALIKISADKSELSRYIALADEALKGDYTSASLAALSTDLETGKAVFDNAAAEQDEVDLATANIKSKYNALVDLSDLRAAYVALTEIVAEDVIKEAYLSVVSEAVLSVGEVLGKQDASIEEIESALSVATSAAKVTSLVADYKLDFSSVQGENGWTYLTHDGFSWTWPESTFGPENVTELTFDAAANVYTSENGNVLGKGGFVSPKTWNNKCSIIGWQAFADGVYDISINIAFDDLNGGRASVRAMLMDVSGKFKSVFLEEYELGTSASKMNCSLYKKDFTVLKGEKIYIVLFDENNVVSGDIEVAVYSKGLYKAALENMVEKCESVNESAYTSDSYSALQTALSEAKIALSGSDQKSINAALHKLEKAYGSLVTI